MRGTREDAPKEGRQETRNQQDHQKSGSNEESRNHLAGVYAILTRPTSVASSNRYAATGSGFSFFNSRRSFMRAL